jgi:hypothetical protein
MSGGSSRRALPGTSSENVRRRQIRQMKRTMMKLLSWNHGLANAREASQKSSYSTDVGCPLFEK